MIDPANTLYVLIQVSVAIAGFAGIVSAVREDHKQEVFRFRLFTLLYCAFATLLVAAFALVLMHAGTAPAAAWRATGTLGIVTTLTGIVLSWRRIRAMGGQHPQLQRRVPSIAINGTLALNLGLQIYNVIDWAAFWPVLVGILWPFGLACYSFTQLHFGGEQK
jgi:hypothetical protein